MNILSQLTEYKEKVEALALKASLADSLSKSLETVTADKEALAGSLVEKEAALAEVSAKAEEFAAEIEALKTTVETLEADKKASDEKALEIVASLGLSALPVVDSTSHEKPTAESIRNKYMAITDPNEKGRFFAENKQALLNGFVD